ncbi:MAG: hypothetical protein AAB839_00905 [Patescibacteria group bacterium]
MLKETLKKLFVLVVAAVVSLSAPSAYALTMIGDPSDEIIDNVLNAKSVDFNLDIDVETDNDHLEKPVKMHVDVDVITDFDDNTAVDFDMWSTDESGAFYEAEGSVMLIDDVLYLSENGEKWYFVEQTNATPVPSEDDVDQGAEEIKGFMNDLFEHDVIEYQPESAEVINKTMTVRYAYTINNDRLVDYLVDNGTISESESKEMRTSLAEDVTIGGDFWVDTVAMLPVMFTLRINAKSSATSYTNVEISVLFNSFNETVSLEAPKNAVSIEEFEMSESEELVMSSIEDNLANMDIDGDGLTNEDEESIWHSNPMSADTDGDGYPDYTEVINGYDPNGSGKLDSDRDGLTDYAEMTIHWSNRFDADSDNDGYNDGLEIANGYNPNGPGRW